VTPAWSHEQQRQIDALLDELLDLPEDQRLAVLEQKGALDAAVLAEVRSLLRAVQALGDFLRTADGATGEGSPEAAPALPPDIQLGHWYIARLLARRKG
jgi:hypothetical protein